MNNETKWNVFEDALRALEEFGEQGSSWEMAYDDLSARYDVASDEALPDDMPVIPEYVADYIVYWKEQNNSLIDIALESAHTRMDSDDSSEAFDWVHNHFEKFSRAWLDGFHFEAKCNGARY